MQIWEKKKKKVTSPNQYPPGRLKITELIYISGEDVMLFSASSEAKKIICWDE